MPLCHARGGNSESEVLVAASCWEDVLRNHAVVPRPRRPFRGRSDLARGLLGRGATAFSRGASRQRRAKVATRGRKSESEVLVAASCWEEVLPPSAVVRRAGGAPRKRPAAATARARCLWPRAAGKRCFEQCRRASRQRRAKKATCGGKSEMLLTARKGRRAHSCLRHDGHARLWHAFGVTPETPAGRDTLPPL